MASPSATLSFATNPFAEIPPFAQLNRPTIAGIAGIVLLVTFVVSYSAKGRKFPPGPKKVPLLGNLLDLPKEHHWHYYKELSQKYGDIVHLKLGTNDVVLLSKPEYAHELFSKRGANYSSRKNNIYYSDYQSNKLRSGLLPQCAEQKKQRKAMMQMLFPNQIGIYRDHHVLEARRICHTFAEQSRERGSNNVDFVNLFRRLTMNAASWAAYGYPGDDEKQKKVMQIAQDEVYHMSPGSHLVDLFPFLDYLPDFLSPWRVAAKAAYVDESQFYLGCMRETQEKYKRGLPVPECLTTKLLARQEELGITDLDIAYICGQTFEGGTETTAAVFHVFIHAMVLHPEVQKRAQEEIDRVCGNRSPSFDDDLPYVKCCVKELLRWRTVEPTGFPHTNDWEDEFMGYTIPKGTLVFPVTHNMHSDESVYPDHDTFNPDRYKDDKSTMTEGHYTFGFGRRDCPGMHLAAQLLFIVVAHLFAHITIEKAVDPKTGEEIPVHFKDYTGNAIGSQPKPFVCSIKPRNTTHAQIVEKEWKEYVDQGLA